jgi:hypothetical protein
LKFFQLFPLPFPPARSLTFAELPWHITGMMLIDKELFKRSAGKCRFCPVNRYELLDVHRIIPGERDGQYTPDNVVVVCANCHRAIHRGAIQIDRWYMSSAGRVLRVLVNGEERFY